MQLNRREACKLLAAACAGNISPLHSFANVVAKEGKAYQLMELSEVHLLSGPFNTASKLNLKYLETLDPDRLLAWFRREAGLTPKRPVYGGWESEIIWGDQTLPGAILGFYLSAMANHFAQTHEEWIQERLAYIVDELAACQAAFGDGYLLPTKNGRQLFARVSAGEIVTAIGTINGVFEPLYVLNKITLGLYDVHHQARIGRARTVLLAAVDWLGKKLLNSLNDEQMQRLLYCEHGSLNESVVNCYRLTQDQRYLDWAQRLNDQSMLIPFSQGKDILDGLHANTQIPKFTGFLSIFSYTKDPALLRAATNFWEAVAIKRAWANGGNSTDEHFFPVEESAERLVATTGPESCNSVNMLRLTEALYNNSPSCILGDFYERVLFNHVLPGHDPDRGMCCYFTSMRPGHYRTYGSEEESFWCCVGTGMQSPSRYAAFIYGRSESALLINLFISSEACWHEGDKTMTVRQETRLPEEEKTVLTILCSEEHKMALRIRHPHWIRQSHLTVSINGKPEQHPSTAGAFLTLDRVWKNGDRVEVSLPMQLSIERLNGLDGFATIFYGPILLAGRLGTENLETEEFHPKMDHFASRAISLAKTPFLAGTDEQILAGISRVGGAGGLAFSLKATDASEQITLAPLYRIHFERYAIYWRSFPDDSSRQTYRRRLLASTSALEDLNRSAIDSVIIGDFQSEQAHLFEEVSTASGDEDEHSWRKAVNGGWMSCELSTKPGSGHDLILEYHGAEVESNRFTILVNGKELVSEQDLKNFDMPVRYGKTYRLNPAMIGMTGKVTVKLQAQWHYNSARLFAMHLVPNIS